MAVYGTQERFVDFNRRVGNHKTGVYGNGVDMYTKRSGNHERVFRVQWYERSRRYPTHADWKKLLLALRTAGSRVAALVASG